MHSNALSTAVLTHSSPFWHSELHPSMPSFHDLLSSCTNARLGSLFLPESATPTWQSSRFTNELMPTLMPPSHRQTNDANLLHPCMPVSPLWCTTPSISSGSLPLWYMSCWKTATKCAPAMAWSTAVWDNTFVNAVSNPLTLPQFVTTATLQAPTRPHISANITCTCQACTTAAASTCCTCNMCDYKTTDTSCPWSCPCACTYACNTQYSPCAAP